MTSGLSKHIAAVALLAWCILNPQLLGATPPFNNRLATATSQYLREAAHQPVHWQPWGVEAFRLAQQLDRPILLDIGAIWCHWCHVMDEETYSNPGVAKIINDYFVPVKVDRDERPDIDTRYQAQVRTLTGYSGWPLTVFMIPDGKVFYGGGTFFPERRGNLPGFKLVLQEVYKAYTEKKKEVVKTAEELYRTVAELESMQVQSGKLNQGLVKTIQTRLVEGFDQRYGGFGNGSKFSIAGAIELALQGYFDTGDREILEVATRTLEAMRRGGVHDQLGGGFHRYTIDIEWRIPHFEKILTDQAQLLKDYLLAYQATGNHNYRNVAEGIIQYVRESLSNQSQGGFYAHQDADMGPKDDGGYYTWTEAEVRKALPREEAEVLLRYFDVSAHGEMRDESNRNVLWVARTPEQVAAEIGVPVAEVETLIDSGKAKLLTLRRRRKTPLVDKTILSDRNGMMISAYIRGYKVLHSTQLKAFALKSLNFLLDHVYVPGNGLHHAYADGKPTVPGMLQDQVQVAAALVDAFEVTGESRYLTVSKDIMDYTLREFWDPKGGFFDRQKAGRGLGILNLRNKPFTDDSAPAGNPAAALVLSRLYYLTNDSAYRDRARQTLEAFAGAVQVQGVHASTYALAMDLLLKAPLHAVIIGAHSKPETVSLWEAALRTYRPGKIVAAYDADNVQVDSLPPAVAAAVNIGQQERTPKAYVCRGLVCSLPSADPETVADLVRNFGRAP